MTILQTFTSYSTIYLLWFFSGLCCLQLQCDWTGLMWKLM